MNKLPVVTAIGIYLLMVTSGCDALDSKLYKKLYDECVPHCAMAGSNYAYDDCQRICIAQLREIKNHETN